MEKGEDFRFFIHVVTVLQVRLSLRLFRRRHCGHLGYFAAC
jgi:hypothetical protein